MTPQHSQTNFDRLSFNNAKCSQHETLSQANCMSVSNSRRKFVGHNFMCANTKRNRVCFLQLQFIIPHSSMKTLKRTSSKVSLLLCQQSTNPRVQKRIQWCASMAQIVKHEQVLLARAFRRVDAHAKLLVLGGAIRGVVDAGV